MRSSIRRPCRLRRRSGRNEGRTPKSWVHDNRCSSAIERRIVDGATKANSDTSKGGAVWLGELNRPVRVRQRRKQWKPVVDKCRAVGNKELASQSELRTHSGEQGKVVAIGNLQHRETPDSPPLMTALASLGQSLVSHRGHAEANNDDPLWNRLVTKLQRFKHLSRLRVRPVDEGRTPTSIRNLTHS